MPLSKLKKLMAIWKTKSPGACAPGLEGINSDYGIKCGGETELPRLQVMDGKVPIAAKL